ncbi:hypothetical protein CDD82_2179 [Ophiocordyceps australis]|uniref:BZIP domain-containing protein n=1 Tax=Ophiocordyceps australis TaxID=1399860 RepID=A0A2C5ZKH9_9HYPO|nr:hypothetical protein CDD82_2179 [Ophiocordyceps australis]
MSTYSGRHGPNVSQFLRDLNTISPQDTTTDDAFSMEDDLALFTNTQFFDFDSGQNLDYQAQPSNSKAEAQGTAHSTPSVSGDVTASSAMGEIPSMDFIPGNFAFNEFNHAYAATPLNPFPDGTPNYQPLQPNQAAVQTPQQFQANSTGQSDKRKSDAMSVTGQQVTLEETSRLAAEEDKRRRNTAASARFRIKKKQREQALEKSAKEMSDKISNLESKVSQLEQENQWLKNLLVEKNEGSEDISSLWKEFLKHASEKAKATPAESTVDTVKPER